MEQVGTNKETIKGCNFQFWREKTEVDYDEQMKVQLSKMDADYHSTNPAVQEIDAIK